MFGATVSDPSGRDPFGPNNGKEFVGPTPPAPLEPGGSWIRQRLFFASYGVDTNGKISHPPPKWVFRPRAWITAANEQQARMDARQAEIERANERFRNDKRKLWTFEGEWGEDDWEDSITFGGHDLPGVLLPPDADLNALEGIRFRVTIERLD